MADKHKVLFKWPHSEPAEVIVAGSFNDWTRTCHLTKGPTGFTGFTYVPWGSKITYKYIVDGTWNTHPDQPTEPDEDGNINNMYIAPSQPESKPNGNGKPAPAKAPDTTTGSLPQLVAHLADTVVAREGTSSALEYVASGFGAALNSVVGVDPINAEQIAIPTPLQTAATTTTEFDVPGSAVSDGAPLPSVPAKVPSPQHSVSENPAASEESKVSTSGPPAKVAPDIPVPIVPVNAAENNMISTPVVEPVITPAEKDVCDTGMEKKDDQPEKSTHTPIKVNEDVPIVEDNTNKAEEILVTVEEPHAAIDAIPAAESVISGKEDTSKIVDVPVAAAADEPSLAASADHAPMEEPSNEAHKSMKTPETTTASDLNTSSVVASAKSPAGAASAPPEEKAISQDIPVPVAPLQKELVKLEQIKSEPVAYNVKVEPTPISAPEHSLEMSDVAARPAVAETAPEPAAEPEAKKETEESVLVESAPFVGQVLASPSPALQKTVESGTEPSVEPVSVKQDDKVLEAEAATKQGEPTSVPKQESPASEPQPASVPTTGAAATEPTLASMVVATPTDQVAAPATETAPTEPMLAPAAGVRPAEPLSASPTAQPVPAPIIQAASTEFTPTLATKAPPAEPAPKTEAAPTGILSEPQSESVPTPPTSEPVAATLTPSNGHAKGTAGPAPASAPAKEAFPSTASPTASPSKSERAVSARKKKSSIFGRIKHFFESDKDKSKK